jgi:hypothetical protein
MNAAICASIFIEGALEECFDCAQVGESAGQSWTEDAIVGAGKEDCDTQAE